MCASHRDYCDNDDDDYYYYDDDYYDEYCYYYYYYSCYCNYYYYYYLCRLIVQGLGLRYGGSSIHQPSASRRHLRLGLGRGGRPPPRGGAL